MKKLFTVLLLSCLIALFAEDKKAPQFALKNLKGKSVELKSLLEKGPVLINFWASYCSPCKEEMPEFNQIYKTYKDKGFNILAVSVDKGSGIATATSFAKTQAFDYEVLFDNCGEIYKKYGGKGTLPLSILVSKDGKIVFEQTGKLARKTLEDEIKKNL